MQNIHVCNNGRSGDGGGREGTGKRLVDLFLVHIGGLVFLVHQIGYVND